MKRLRFDLKGAVQGVGFRPFVFRLANSLGLAGWVLNSASGVSVEVEGEEGTLDEFRMRLQSEIPPMSYVSSIEVTILEPAGLEGFEIRRSIGGETEAVVLPDMATCRDCRREVLDPGDRRYLYPFTNCTNCGPRFSIITALPYDRPGTTMKRFEMCPDCLREYEDPYDRRFHAQPNACPVCGPHLELWDGGGRVIATHHEALLETAKAVLDGRIAAVKGLGGFHLITRAYPDEPVMRLRRRKMRPAKPLAVMAPGIECVSTFCLMGDVEKRLLVSPEAPIVLLERDDDGCENRISHSVAPGNPYLGVMLPYTPLHILLLSEIGIPVVATSGNLSDEPICTDENEALSRLGGIADVFLVHDRPIARHVDDSVLAVFGEREMMLRRARGFAPLPVHRQGIRPTIVAVGGHKKNTVAVTRKDQVFLSSHIGDMETAESIRAFREVIGSLCGLYRIEPDLLVHDMHPDYVTSTLAKRYGKRTLAVQHHYAHVLSCMTENGLDPPLLGVSWDGSGYGTDGTIWGGEFLEILRDGSYRRVAHMRKFPLPGGEKAVREPRRSAAGLLSELFHDPFDSCSALASAFSEEEAAVLKNMLHKKVNTPLTSSAGRLFDAVASLLNLNQRIEFEGQAAMALEFLLKDANGDESYVIELQHGGAEPMVLDWEPMIHSVLADIDAGLPAEQVSLRFHNGLVECIIGVAQSIGRNRVVLTGGCFQNRYLSERASRRLEQDGFEVVTHRLVPPNDGGLSLGQAIAADYMLNTTMRRE
jgi:hydrogenase maturation protein HypF